MRLGKGERTALSVLVDGGDANLSVALDAVIS
jgi:hypothetical protein